MFTSALSVMVQNWDKSKYPLAGGWKGIVCSVELNTAVKTLLIGAPTLRVRSTAVGEDAPPAVYDARRHCELQNGQRSL